MGKTRYGHSVIAEKPENMRLLAKLGIDENMNTKMDV
jgi:hypothetical protein